MMQISLELLCEFAKVGSIERTRRRVKYGTHVRGFFP